MKPRVHWLCPYGEGKACRCGYKGQRWAYSLALVTCLRCLAATACAHCEARRDRKA